MNNYVVARNAMIATIFVMLFMLTLQPQHMSRAILGVSDTISDRFMTQNINAAEKNTSADNPISVEVNAVNLTLPTDSNLSFESSQNAAILSKDGQSAFVMTIEEYNDDVKNKAISLSQGLKDEGGFTEIKVQPVLRGSNMFYEVSSNEQGVHYALIKVTDDKVLTIVPTSEVEKEVVNKILSEIEYK